MKPVIVARHAATTPDPGLLDVVYDPADVGIRWNVDTYGVERIEATLKARNKWERWGAMRSHMNQRLSVFDDQNFHVVNGWITEIDEAGANRLKYVAKGPMWRSRETLITDVFDNTDDIPTLLQSVLTNIPGVDTDNTNIDSNSTTIGGYQPRLPEGNYPHEIIRDLVNMGDSSGNVYDFFLKDAAMNGTSLNTWLPYYKARSGSASYNWLVKRSDLRDLDFGVDVNGIVTSATVYYGMITGTHNGAGNSATLIDTTTNFLTQGVREGDRVTNITDGSRGVVSSLSTTTNPNDTITLANGLTGGTDDDFDASDVYSIELQELTACSTPGSGSSSYFGQAVSERQPRMNDTQANQYAASLIQTNFQAVISFTITAPYIMDSNGAKWELWKVISRIGNRYIAIADLFPDEEIFTTSQNNLTTGIITALDYDGRNNALRVTTAINDTKLDSRLRAAGILRSEGITRLS